MRFHTGILTQHISVDEGGGLIFAAGTAVTMLTAFPALIPVAGLALVGGCVLAYFLHRHWWY
jgi:hypothetical protein